MTHTKKLTILSLILIIGTILFGIIIITDRHVSNIERRVPSKREEKTPTNPSGERLVMIDGKLYYDTGIESSITSRCGIKDGRIESHIGSFETPTQNNESNFPGEYEYQFSSSTTVDLYINEKWMIFQEKNSFVPYKNFELKIETIEDKNSKNPSLYYEDKEQAIYFVSIKDFYLNISNQKISLKEFIKASNETIDTIITKIGNKMSLEAVLYDGGTIVYRDGGKIKQQSEEPKVSNNGLTIIKCFRMNAKKNIYIAPSDIDYAQKYGKYCKIPTS